MNEIDLHCHTSASDGALSPSQLVYRAARLALRTIAITDHDSVSGVHQRPRAIGAHTQVRPYRSPRNILS